MSRNVLIAVILGVALIAGGFVFVASNDEANAPSESSEQSNNNDQSGSLFSPSSNSDRDVIAKITAGAGQGEAEFAYDADSKSVRYTANSDGQEISFINTPDGYFVQANGTWLKYPMGTPVSADTEGYQYTNEELSTFRNSATKTGTEACGNSTCDVWRYEQSGAVSTFYIQNGTNLIVKIVSESSGQSSTIEYSYEEVTIEIPTDYQEVPGL